MKCLNFVLNSSTKLYFTSAVPRQEVTSRSWWLNWQSMTYSDTPRHSSSTVLLLVLLPLLFLPSSSSSTSVVFIFCRILIVLFYYFVSGCWWPNMTDNVKMPFYWRRKHLKKAAACRQGRKDSSTETVPPVTWAFISFSISWTHLPKRSVRFTNELLKTIP